MRTRINSPNLTRIESNSTGPTRPARPGVLQNPPDRIARIRVVGAARHVQGGRRRTVRDAGRRVTPDQVARKPARRAAVRATSRTFAALHEVALIDEYFGAYAAHDFDVTRTDERIDLIETTWDTPLPVTIDWPSWCRAAGRDAWLERALFRHFDDEHYALQAVLHGQGVGLLSSVLVAEHVERGALVAIDPSVRLAGARFVALCRPGREREPQVRRFLDWLEAEIARTRAAVARIAPGA